MANTYKNATKVKIGNLELEVDHKDKRVFHLSQNKEGRKQQLKEFIYTKLSQRWMTITKAQATLEKEFVRELLKSL